MDPIKRNSALNGMQKIFRRGLFIVARTLLCILHSNALNYPFTYGASNNTDSLVIRFAACRRSSYDVRHRVTPSGVQTLLITSYFRLWEFRKQADLDC
jgi:hypothetical protein